MDSKPKADCKGLAAQVVPDHTPEAAMTEYFLSKYEQRLSKYVSSTRIIYKNIPEVSYYQSKCQ
jgi:hypothetical protein